jgi:hypothetical protein
MYLIFIIADRTQGVTEPFLLLLLFILTADGFLPVAVVLQ